MPNILTKIFSAGAEKLVGAVGDAFDKNFTNKEEKEAAKLEAQKEVNRHLEAIMLDTTKQLELENQDRASARGRESDFVKSTGHIDWFQTGFGAVMLLLFAYTIYVSSNGSIPQDMREIFIEGRAAVRDIVLAIAGYYWGSSAGSRVKDMKPSK